MSKPKNFLVQIRRRGLPTSLKFVDLRSDTYWLMICTNTAEEGLLSITTAAGNDTDLGPLLNRCSAKELAEAMLRYTETGMLVSKRRRPVRERCRWCGKKSVDPRATWTEPSRYSDGEVRFRGPKCTTTGCDYREGKWVLGISFPKESKS